MAPFLALLELVRERLRWIVQNEPFAPIYAQVAQADQADQNADSHDADDDGNTRIRRRRPPSLTIQALPVGKHPGRSA